YGCRRTAPRGCRPQQPPYLLSLGAGRALRFGPGWAGPGKGSRPGRYQSWRLPPRKWLALFTGPGKDPDAAAAAAPARTAPGYSSPGAALAPGRRTTTPRPATAADVEETGRWEAVSHMSDRYDHNVDENPARRWLTLAAGTIALTAGCTFQYGLAYLIPALRARGLSLEEAGVLVACPTAGLLLTLVAWGAAADRFGERLVLASGLAAAGVILLAASQ